MAEEDDEARVRDANEAAFVALYDDLPDCQRDWLGLVTLALSGPDADEILSLLRRHRAGEVVADQYIAPTGEVLTVNPNGAVPAGCLPIRDLVEGLGR